MKRQILSALGITILGVASYASTFMQVKTKDGEIVKFDVNDVDEVFFEDVASPVDTTPSSNHEYVDLGLPSGTLWATYNIGATKPEEYGDYFAWGETEPKEVYDWSTYKYAKVDKYSDLESLSRYNFGKYRKKGVIDSLSILIPEDDVTTVIWGNEWRMPTNEEQRELVEECYVVWTDSYNGSDVGGIIVYKAKNADDKGKFVGKQQTPLTDYTATDAHIFLPAAGYLFASDTFYVGKSGFYWSATLYEASDAYSRHIRFYEKEAYFYYHFRQTGFPVRAVRAK